MIKHVFKEKNEFFSIVKIFLILGFAGLLIVLPVDLLCDYLRNEKGLPITWLDFYSVTVPLVILAKFYWDYKNYKLNKWTLISQSTSTKAFVYLCFLLNLFLLPGFLLGIYEPLEYYESIGRYKGFEGHGYSSVTLGILTLCITSLCALARFGVIKTKRPRGSRKLHKT